jgi:aryl-alcohol dehydrogenase-like predicted oxidoreductase
MESAAVFRPADSMREPPLARQRTSSLGCGALPIPGAKSPRQAQENAGALGWRLSDDAIARLDEASNRVSHRV